MLSTTSLRIGFRSSGSLSSGGRTLSNRSIARTTLAPSGRSHGVSGTNAPGSKTAFTRVAINHLPFPVVWRSVKLYA